MNGRKQGFESEEATNLAPWQARAEQDPGGAPKRPTDIALRQISTTEAVVMSATSIPSTSTSNTACHVQRSSSSSSDDFIHVPLPSDDSSSPSRTRSKSPQTQKTPTLPKLSETRESPSSPPPVFSASSQLMEAEEFFTINQIHMCICGQWLCVSNAGGVAMAFDFRLKNTEKEKAKVRAVICVYKVAYLRVTLKNN